MCRALFRFPDYLGRLSTFPHSVRADLRDYGASSQRHRESHAFKRERTPPFALTPGYALFPGDHVDTRGGGRLVVDLSDGSVVIVQPETVLLIKDFRSASSLRELFEITLGLVRVKINHFAGRPNPYRMNSPTASIAVRGTEFSIAVSAQGDTNVEVFEGEVEVSSLENPERRSLIQSGGGVLVRPGQDFRFYAAPGGREIAQRGPGPPGDRDRNGMPGRPENGPFKGPPGPDLARRGEPDRDRALVPPPPGNPQKLGGPGQREPQRGPEGPVMHSAEENHPPPGATTHLGRLRALMTATSPVYPKSARFRFCTALTPSRKCTWIAWRTPRTLRNSARPRHACSYCQPGAEVTHYKKMPRSSGPEEPAPPTTVFRPRSLCSCHSREAALWPEATLRVPI